MVSLSNVSLGGQTTSTCQDILLFATVIKERKTAHTHTKCYENSFENVSKESIYVL